MQICTGVPAGDSQNWVRFSRDCSELVTNGRQRVYFWASQLPISKAFNYYSPPLFASDFKQAIGQFTMSTFVPSTKQVRIATRCLLKSCCNTGT